MFCVTRWISVSERPFFGTNLHPRSSAPGDAPNLLPSLGTPKGIAPIDFEALGQNNAPNFSLGVLSGLRVIPRVYIFSA